MKPLLLILIAALITVSCTNDQSGTGATPTSKDTLQQERHRTTSGSSMDDIMSKMMNEMHAVSSSGNADRDFAALMKAHHQGAVDMAKAQIATGKDTAMTNMANRILTDQTREIAAFDAFLARPVSDAKKDSAFYTETMADMHKMHSMGAEGGSTDQQFVQSMIPHHQGAVDMATVYLKYGHDAALKTLAQNIIKSQKAEILIFQSWLQKNGGSGAHH